MRTGIHACLETSLTTQQQEVCTAENTMQGKSTGLEVRNLAATNKSCDLGQVIPPPETPVSTSLKMGVTLPALREEGNEVMLRKRSGK